jgi:hypothetical protein
LLNSSPLPLCPTGRITSHPLLFNYCFLTIASLMVCQLPMTI